MIFPRLPQIYYVQWKLLLNLIIIIWVAREKNLCGTELSSIRNIRDFSYFLQKKFVAIDEEKASHERIPPSYFDYEYIYLRLSETLDSSINLTNNTSNTYKSIFQNKYFCHDDYSDPEFHTDYMLANMFAPSALLIQEEVTDTHKELITMVTRTSKTGHTS
ncbi:MAG: hypothetical protein NMNS02_28560 [Nitrosomonas sp.]|nr:MAG: hypothetical protein NMNS02_28560 [Nitrosomonas sp.]